MAVAGAIGPGRIGAVPVTDVVLLHAFPLDHRMWSHQARALTEAGYRVLTPDYRGFGPDWRARGEELPPEPNLDVFTDDVVALLDRHGLDRAIIGGLSLGGYVAMNLLRRHPDRIAALLLADTRANADADAAREGRLAFADRVDAEGSEWVPDAMLGNLLGPRAFATAELVAELSGWITAASPAAIAWTQRAMAARPDSFAALRAFAGPALVVVGQEDQTTPVETVAQVAAALPGAQPQRRFVEIPRAGHLSAVEEPAIVSAAVLDWVSHLK